MDTAKVEEILKLAEEALDVSGSDKAYGILKPLLDKELPAALFLYATFGMLKAETEEEFERRRIGLIIKAADAGYAPATYELAICYDLGEHVAVDTTLAGRLYKKAAEAGFSKAKLSHGLNLLYGSNGIEKNPQEASFWIEQAVNENVDGARDALAKLG